VDFFARQEQSKRNSRYLVILFGLAFTAVALATSLAVAVILNFLPDNVDSVTILDSPGRLTDLARIVLGVMAVTILLMALASLYRAATLSRGGAQVARMLGGTEIHADTTDRLHRRLFNVVEEIAIASGLPVPEVFVLEQESGINAFAAGLTHGDAAIAVTRGALDRLSRAELQGVIAHEFSHILNGDMRLNQRLIGYSFGILVLSLVGRWMLRSQRFVRRGRNRGLPVVLMLGLALTVIGAIGVFFSRLIKAGVSRQREVLADASAVQFTREPSALAGALKKIAGFTASLSSVETEEVAHMLFGPGSRAFRGWFATHPPIVERIRALDPHFKPDDGTVSQPAAASSSEEPGVASLAPTSTDELLARTGQIESPGVGIALRTAFPEELHAAAHSRDSGPLLIAAMALSQDPETHERQMAFLQQRLGAERALRCERLHRELLSLDVHLRLPLLETAVPALRHRPDEQIEFLFDLLGSLLELDPAVQFFEFILVRVLNASLPTHRRLVFASDKPRARVPARDAGRLLLAIVARFGHENRHDWEAAYRAGVALLDAKYAAAPFPDTAASAGHDALALLDGTLEQLAGRRPAEKRRLLGALLATIHHDRRVTIRETELYRAISATLDCPVPPPALPRDVATSRKE
jgi:Zn-dependent protease with chaperone function